VTQDKREAKIGYIVGAGAQGRVVAEVWRAQDPHVRLHFLDDDPTLLGRSVLDIPVVGALNDAALDIGDGEVMLAIGNNARRLELADFGDRRGLRWATVVHPSAVVMSSAEIGAGTVLFAQAVVNSGARLGRHVIVNTAAVVEHDGDVEDGSSLGPGACTGGRVYIGRGAFVSTGVTIAPRVRIGAGAVVGAGAAVVDDVPANVLAYGVPARVVRAIDARFDYGRLL
jgi:sugar O-acyltransferase (sialic acid O-acetyltransferase NeuD family)